jgi:hypothetical protein
VSCYYFQEFGTRIFLLWNVNGTKTLTGSHTTRSVDGAADDGLLEHPTRRGENTIISYPRAAPFSIAHEY